MRRPRVRTKVLTLLLASVAVGGLIAVGVMVNSDREGTAFAVGAGVLGSLVASFYAILVNVLVLGDTAAEADRLQAVVDRLERGAPLLEQARHHAVLAVKPKSAYGPNEWLALLDAREELFIVGHALHKWCRDDVRGPFIEAIRRLVTDGRRVRLVVLPLEGEVTKRLSEQRGKNYGKRVQETLETLADLSGSLPAERRALLDVRQLHNDAPMPYMLAGNEQVLVTAPYPIAADSDTMLAVTVAARGPLGAAILDDLRRLVAMHSESVDLSAFETADGHSPRTPHSSGP